MLTPLTSDPKKDHRSDALQFRANKIIIILWATDLGFGQEIACCIPLQAQGFFPVPSGPAAASTLSSTSTAPWIPVITDAPQPPFPHPSQPKGQLEARSGKNPRWCKASDRALLPGAGWSWHRIAYLGRLERFLLPKKIHHPTRTIWCEM